MPFSLEEFIHSFKSGIAKTNRFRVSFASPSGISIPNFNSRRISLRCEIAELPGKSFPTVERRTYGSVKKVPYGALYEPLSLTFICSGDMLERKIFDSWLDGIEENSNFEYYDNYITDIDIEQYNEEDNLISRYKYLEAYPMTVQPQPLNWADNNEYLKLSVVFTYFKWIREI